MFGDWYCDEVNDPQWDKFVNFVNSVLEGSEDYSEPVRNGVEEAYKFSTEWAKPRNQSQYWWWMENCLKPHYFKNGKVVVKIGKEKITL